MSLFLAGIALGQAEDYRIHIWERLDLNTHFWSEGADVGDFNHDGQLDVVSGPFWYAGPDFEARHEYRPAKAKFDVERDGTKSTLPGYPGALSGRNAYSDNFFNFTHDLNDDDWTDILVVGMPGTETWWFENPQNKTGHWKRHLAFKVTDNESPAFADLTGDGKPELVFHQGGLLGYAEPNWSEPTQPFVFHPISAKGNWQRYTHGLGFGDINGDGRNDFLMKEGWWEQPASLADDPEWRFHPAPLGAGGAQMFAYDVNGDGLNDVITSLAAHGWGLAWFEQYRGDGMIQFRQHTLTGSREDENPFGIKFSQIHALALADIDRDGLKDIVTGKRFWAHGPTGDVEPGAPAVLYWFKLVRGKNGKVTWIPHLIDSDSGVGTQVVIRDLDGDLLPEVIVGNKKGAFVHLHQAKEVGKDSWLNNQPVKGIFSGPDFKTLVRKAGPLSPEESLKTFSVPDGFRMELVAASPEIGQPMNLAFDERGRLWVTSTLEYPFAVPLDQVGRDTIKVMEDTTGDGRFDTTRVFADGLNIPTGIYPYKDGAIAWSIPNIWFFRDTDGDGKADKREKLYGPLGYERDTHGMHSSFTRGLDGWLHITHGFNNNTKVNASDGSSITMNSGNTYRVRPDGSSVEQFTHGQVNPFGMCLDSFGNFYTADCHSSPVYQLIQDAYYPSFGKPHDGMGFAPLVIQHNHNSTGLCGIVFSKDNHWPAEFQDNIFVGNVVTSRINRDKIHWHGSSPKGVELPDLVRTNDPWFRPVCLQFGPDGALYIADFYNRIIGHYEVRLDHPGRDREQGRIWRLVYDDPRGQFKPEKVDLSKVSLDRAIAELGSPMLARRLLATDFLADDVGQRAAMALDQAMDKPGASPMLKAHGAWVLQRLDLLDESTHLLLGKDKSELVRTHAQRIAGALKYWSPITRQMVLAGLKDTSPQVRRAAADTLLRHPHVDHVRPLLSALAEVHALDEHLRHAVKIALRNNLRAVDDPSKFDDLKNHPESLRQLMSVALAVHSPFAGSLLLASIHDPEIKRDQLVTYLRHIARNAPQEGLNRLAEIVRKKFDGDLDFQTELLLAINEGIFQRGLTPERGLLKWAEDLTGRLLDISEAAEMHWITVPAKGVPPSDIPWILHKRDFISKQPKWKNHPNPVHPTRSPWISQVRTSRDGIANARYISSLPLGGESLTGILRSVMFTIPNELTFFIAGHRGFPNDPAHNKNHVRLVDAKSGEELRRVYPPRSDIGVPVRWKLDQPGREVYLEVIDGDTGAAFAWLAVARFNIDLKLFDRNTFIGSFPPDGEHMTGVFRSREFDLPPSLSFFLAGQNGPPENPPNRKTYVQLIEIGSGRILKKVFPPRSENGKKVVWDLSNFAGKRARLEIVDADTSGSFAWLAAGVFEPDVAPLPKVDPRHLAKRQITATRIIHDLKLTSALDFATRLATDPFATPAARELAATAILNHGTAAQQGKLVLILENTDEPEALRLVVAKRGTHLAVIQKSLAKTLGQSASDQQLKFARALALNPEGAKELIQIVNVGKAPASLLLDAVIRDTLPKSEDKRVAKLTVNLIKPDADLERLIADRIAGFRETGGNSRLGKIAFTTYCIACHQKGGQGGNIGPQLEGVSNRGLNRLIEDILDPNRNVDVAFRYSVVKLRNGQTILGLKRREVGESIVFADFTGKETIIAKPEILDQEPTNHSLMPEALGQAIPQADFNHLLEFLLAN